MNNIRNKIITISGEPVSGKSTVVSRLEKTYKELGYNVHVISTGTIFREVISSEYYRMYPDRSGVSLADMQTDPEFAKKRNEIDHMIDSEMEKRGKEINSKERPNDVYIIDSRLAWKNIPESFAVRLTIDEDIAGKRVLKDNTRGQEDAYESLDQAIEKTKQRKLGEIERYKERYGVDLTDPEHYDLIIDTSYSNTEELAEIIVNGEKTYRSGKFYPKTWSSPAHFLTSQSIRETCGKSPLGFSIEEIADSIKQNGYDYLDGILDIFQNGEFKFLEDGHHRCMAALSAGKTLVPYEITHKDDERAIQFTDAEFGGRGLTNTYDWIDAMRYYGGKIGKIKQFEKFSDNDLIPLKKFKKKVLSSENER